MQRLSLRLQMLLPMSVRGCMHHRGLNFLIGEVFLDQSHDLGVDFRHQCSAVVRALNQVVSVILAQLSWILDGQEHNIGKLHKRGSVQLVEAHHKPNNFTEVFTIALLEALDTSFDQSFAIKFSSFLVETRYIIHRSELVEHKADRKDVTFVDIVPGKARVTIDNMSLPQDGR